MEQVVMVTELFDKPTKELAYPYWPQKPKEPLSLQNGLEVNLIDLVEKEKSEQASDSPILVHCSAGVGRTGVFITLYHSKQRLERQDYQIALFELIGYLRWQKTLFSWHTVSIQILPCGKI